MGTKQRIVIGQFESLEFDVPVRQFRAGPGRRPERKFQLLPQIHRVWLAWLQPPLRAVPARFHRRPVPQAMLLMVILFSVSACSSLRDRVSGRSWSQTAGAELQQHQGLEGTSNFGSY